MRLKNEHDYYLELGKNILEKRREKGLTQEKLAKISGVSRPTITNIETGKQKASVYNIHLLGHALDFEISFLLPELIGIEDKEEQRKDQIFKIVEQEDAKKSNANI